MEPARIELLRRNWNGLIARTASFFPAELIEHDKRILTFLDAIVAQDRELFRAKSRRQLLENLLADVSEAGIDPAARRKTQRQELRDLEEIIADSTLILSRVDPVFADLERKRRRLLESAAKSAFEEQAEAWDVLTAEAFEIQPAEWAHRYLLPVQQIYDINRRWLGEAGDSDLDRLVGRGARIPIHSRMPAGHVPFTFTSTALARAIVLSPKFQQLLMSRNGHGKGK